MTNYHTPVLLHESVGWLVTNPNGVYVDATFGGGGHSAEILNKLSPNGRLYAFDQDADALNNKIPDERLILIHANFRYLLLFLKHYHIQQIDGILFDLGVSSHQIDKPERGFSTRFDGPLDMRMHSGARLTAEQVVNTYEESRLAFIFWEYGELPQAKKIARIIAHERRFNRITTTTQLKSLFDFIPERKKNKFFAQLFQAIRIEVNQELHALKDALVQSLSLLKPGGRIVSITYHSLEDRLVKRFFRYGNFTTEVESDMFGNRNHPFRLLTKKAIAPSIEEMVRNPRSKSAKLRAAEKI